jgi:voltage-gated potassium channel
VYWAITTLTTVGYGDIGPQTTTGRVIAVTVMFVGISYVAIRTAAMAQQFLATIIG